jgi:hypothetical protein
MYSIPRKFVWSVKTGSLIFMKLKVGVPCMISGSSGEVDENSVLLGCYAAGSGDSSPTFQAQPITFNFKGQQPFGANAR